MALDLTRKLFLQGLGHLAAVRGIGKDYIVFVLLGDILAVNLQSIGQLKIRPLDAVKNHVHGAQKVGERLDLHTIEGVALEFVKLTAAEVAVVANVGRRLPPGTRRCRNRGRKRGRALWAEPPGPWRE